MLVFFFEFVMNFMHFLGLFLPLLILVAFITLLERKEIAIMQKSSGPNIIGVFGLLQPFADGFKLFLKEPVLPYLSSKFLFFFSPVLTFLCSISSWFFLPIGGFGSFLNFDLGLLFIFSFSSLSVYGIIFAGWSSNSKYAFLGALSSASQLIAYEVSFTLALLPLILSIQSFNFENVVFYQGVFCWFIFPFFICGLCVFISILAETNSLPFDLPEAEAELVSGYNVEYSSMVFAFFYLAEYLNMVLMSVIFTIFFLGGWLFYSFSSFIFFSFKVILIVYLIIWISVSFPRYSFDQLLCLGWKNFLPLMMGFYLFSSSILLTFYLIFMQFL